MIQDISNIDTSINTETPEYKLNLLLENEKKLVDFENRQKEISKSPTFLDKADAFLTTNVTGYTTIKEAITEPYQGIADYVTEIRSRPEDLSVDERINILEQAKVKPEDYEAFSTITNIDELGKSLNRYNNFNEANKLISQLPFTEQFAGVAIASLADAPSWIVGAGIGKAFKVADAAVKVTGYSAMALKTIENAAVVSGGVGASEWLLQQENNVVEPERLKDSILFSAAIAGGITLVPSIIQGAGSLSSQLAASKGVQNAVSPMSEKIKNWAIFNPIDSVLTDATATAEMKALAESANTTAYTYKNADGTFKVASSEKAMLFREATVDSLMKELNIPILKESRQSGESLLDVGKKHLAEFREFEKQVEFEAASRFNKAVDAGDFELATLYKAETGVDIPMKDGKITKRPVDLYQVITNGFKKEIEAEGLIQIPTKSGYLHKIFSKVAELGTQVEASGLAGKTSFGYFPVVFNKEVVLSRKASGEAAQHFEEMLRAHPVTAKMLQEASGTELTKLEKEIKKQAEGLVTKAFNDDLRWRYTDDEVATVTNSSKLRTLQMDRTLYTEYFSDNLQETVLSYLDKMAGKITMKKFYNLQTDGGGSLGSKLNNLYTKWGSEGASEKSVENMRAIFESVLGTRKIPSNPHTFDNFAARISKKVATAIYGAGFSLYSLAEVGSIVAKFGIVPTIKEFIPAHSRMLNLMKTLGQDDPLLHYFNNAGIGVMWLRDMKASRFETESLMRYQSKGEQVLDNLNYLGRKVSFFNHIQDTLDFMAGGAYLTHLQLLSNKVVNGKSISKQDLSRLNRYGVSKDMLKKIATENIEYHPNSNMIKDWNFLNWKDKNLARDIQNSLQAAVHDTIVRTDGTRVHRWQSDVDSPIKQMFLQYTQFPMAAYERLTANLDEMSARTAVGAIAAMGISYAAQDLMDAALVQAGVKDKMASEEDLAIKAFTKTQFSTIFPTIYDYIATMTGMKTTSGYQPTQGGLPSSAGVSTINKLLKLASSSPEDFLEGDYKKATADLAGVLPILNSLPLLNIAFKSLTGQTTKEQGQGRDLQLRGSTVMDRILQEHKD